MKMNTFRLVSIEESVLVLIAILGLMNATPMCPVEMMSSDIRIDDQEKLEQAINNLTSVKYNKLECVNSIWKIDQIKLTLWNC